MSKLFSDFKDDNIFGISDKDYTNFGRTGSDDDNQETHNIIGTDSKIYTKQGVCVH